MCMYVFFSGPVQNLKFALFQATKCGGTPCSCWITVTQNQSNASLLTSMQPCTWRGTRSWSLSRYLWWKHDFIDDSSFKSPLFLSHDSFSVQGSEHWQFDELKYTDLTAYPKPLSMLFTGVPSSPDAAFTWTNGNIFFFKGDEYWRVNKLLTIDRGYPLSKKERWMRC